METTELVRAEIIERLKSRDLALAGFSAGFAVLAAGALKDDTSRAMLLPVPYLALAFASIAANHDAVVHSLHSYAKRVGDSRWDRSQELARYHASGWRMVYFVGQLIAFVGSSSIALWLSADTSLANPDQKLAVVWYLGLIVTGLTAIELFWIKYWRHFQGRLKD